MATGSWTVYVDTMERTVLDGCQSFMLEMQGNICAQDAAALSTLPGPDARRFRLGVGVSEATARRLTGELRRRGIAARALDAAPGAVAFFSERLRSFPTLQLTLTAFFFVLMGSQLVMALPAQNKGLMLLTLVSPALLALLVHELYQRSSRRRQLRAPVCAYVAGT